MNHILLDRTIRLSGDDQNRLVSTSLDLRSKNYIIGQKENNLFVAKEVVFGPILSNVTSPDSAISIANHV